MKLTTDNANNGATTAIKWYRGSKAFFMVAGTLGGATVQLQYTPDPGSTVPEWFDVPSGSLNAKGLAAVNLGIGAVRVNITGGAGASINAWLVAVE